jgi:hypothetical protein
MVATGATNVVVYNPIFGGRYFFATLTLLPKTIGRRLLILGFGKDTAPRTLIPLWTVASQIVVVFEIEIHESKLSQSDAAIQIHILNSIQQLNTLIHGFLEGFAT